MKDFIKKKKELVMVFIYIVAIVLLIYFVILPLILKIEEINNQIQEDRLNQEIIKQKISELSKIQQQYNDILEKENILNVFLNKDKAVELIEKIEKLAQDTNNKIEISVQSPQPQVKTSSNKNKKQTEELLISKLPSTDYLQMQIIIFGSYNNMLNFIGKVENMENYSDIVKIKIEQKEKTLTTSPNFGAANPFVSNSATDSTVSPNESAGIDLKTTLDVVFYTEK